MQMFPRAIASAISPRSAGFHLWQILLVPDAERVNHTANAWSAVEALPKSDASDGTAALVAALRAEQPDMIRQPENASKRYDSESSCCNWSAAAC